MRLYRYRPWDGTQSVYDLEDEQLLNTFAEFVMRAGDVGEALRMLLRYGFPLPEGDKALPGLQDLIRQLRQQRDDLLRNYSDQPVSRELGERIRSFRQEELAELERLLEALRDRGPSEGGADTEEMGQSIEQLRGEGSRMGLEDLLRLLQDHPGKHHRHIQKAREELRSDFQRLLESPLLSEEERQKLEGLESQFDDLADLLQFLSRFPLRGDQPLTLEEALQLLQRLRQMERLQEQLEQAYRTGELEEVEEDLVEEVLGQEAAETLRVLRQIKKLLEEAGLIRSSSEGEELTPRGIRQIGEKALRDIFQTLKAEKFGEHTLRRRGAGGSPLDDTRPYQYGDPFTIDLGRTLMNSLHRPKGERMLEIEPEDFEVYHTEYVTQNATVLMLDMSWSMAWYNRFYAAKKVALALDALIRSRYPRDKLYLLGFYAFVQELTMEQLPYTIWMEGILGTNMQQAFRTAARILSRERGANRQIIMISDGEPTAHFEQGQLFFQYPPSRRTLAATLREVVRCTRQGITINTFMLAGNSHMEEFVARLAQINKGRVFLTTPENLGSYLLLDYVEGRRKRIH